MIRFSKTLPGVLDWTRMVFGIAAEPVAQIHRAILAERADGLAGFGVDLLEVIARQKISRRSLPSGLSQ